MIHEKINVTFPTVIKGTDIYESIILKLIWYFALKDYSILQMFNMFCAILNHLNNK